MIRLHDCPTCGKRFGACDLSEYECYLPKITECDNCLGYPPENTVEVNRKYRPKFQWPLKLKDYGDESLK